MMRIAVVTEVVAIALHGVSRLRLAAGEHVVIIGAGAIGSLSAMAALSLDAVPVTWHASEGVFE